MCAKPGANVAEVYLSPRAERDFADIGDYTRDQWSQRQAETYLGQLLNIIRQIGERPLLGQELGELFPAYRRRRSGMHLVFYRITSEGSVEVIRILHQKSDVLRHLGWE